MTWQPASPDLMAVSEVRIQVVDVPRFPEAVDAALFEALDRIGFENPESRAFLMVLATPKAALRLRQVAGLADMMGPKGVATMTRELARDQQIAVLRWQD